MQPDPLPPDDEPTGPATLDLIYGQVRHIGVLQAVDSGRLTRLEDRLEDRLGRLERTAMLLDGATRRLASWSLRLHASRVVAALGPTTARFTVSTAAAFLGGAAAQLLWLLTRHPALP